jgi:hypothetical protein
MLTVSLSSQVKEPSKLRETEEAGLVSRQISVEEGKDSRRVDKGSALKVTSTLDSREYANNK